MTSESNAPIAAAIDIGSNSIKMTVARLAPQGKLEQLDWASEVVRLGHDLEQTGRLHEQRIEAAIETLRRFAARARELGATTLLGVATEATRAAANGPSFLDRVRAETGIDVRVIDGDEEAALTFRGIAATSDMSGKVVVADIGGGSTELIDARDGALRAAKSIVLGSGRLTDRLVTSDPPTSEELAAARAAAEAAVRPVLASMDGSPSDEARLIVLGGTGEYLTRLVPADQEIDLDTLAALLKRLTAVPASALASELAIPEARARVLPAGVAIVAAIADCLRPIQIETSHSGVRAGLLLDALGNRRDEPNGNQRGRVEPTPAELPQAVEVGERRSAPDDGFRETMNALIAQRWAAVWRAIPVALEGTDIEGVHDVRVASRRLRAAMDIAAPAFPHGWYRSLHRTAKDITGALGEVRDRDVLLEALQRDRETAPLVERPGIERLIDRLEQERSRARVEMEEFLRTLLDGPVQSEVERRFGPIDSHGKRSRSSNGSGR
jgi:exopolyphosphatase/pppGpp-phosphohydrolase